MIVMLQLFVSDFRTLLTGKTTKHTKQLLCLAHIYSGVLSENNFMLKPTNSGLNQHGITR